MQQEIDPQTTSRTSASHLWMSSPMPMVTLVKTLDITRLVRYSRRQHTSLNMLLRLAHRQGGQRLCEVLRHPRVGKTLPL